MAVKATGSVTIPFTDLVLEDIDDVDEVHGQIRSDVGDAISKSCSAWQKATDDMLIDVYIDTADKVMQVAHVVWRFSADIRFDPSNRDDLVDWAQMNAMSIAEDVSIDADVVDWDVSDTHDYDTDDGELPTRASIADRRLAEVSAELNQQLAYAKTDYQAIHSDLQSQLDTLRDGYNLAVTARDDQTVEVERLRNLLRIEREVILRMQDDLIDAAKLEDTARSLVADQPQDQVVFIDATGSELANSIKNEMAVDQDHGDA